MCERCIEQAAQIDGEFLKLMQEARDAFDLLMKRDGLLYHVLNARRENTDSEFDGDGFLEEFTRDLDDDLEALGAASERFRSHSVPREKV